MLKIRSNLFILILALLSLQVILVFIYFNKFDLTNNKLVNPSPHNDYFNLQAYSLSADFYNEAYAQADADFSYQDQVYAGIVPHHLFVKGKIAHFFTGLQQQNIKTVVLIGPNHFETGTANILLSQAQWQTSEGILLPDEKFIKALSKTNGLQIDDQAFIGEHSISGLVPFIKKSLPQAKIVPIILKYKTTQDQAKDLALDIAKFADDQTLVLASVDFSHYQTALVADFHDQLSQAVIEGFDFERVAKLEIDSPTSILAVLYYTQAKQAQTAELLAHTNSSNLLDQPDLAGTSHQFYYFTKGKVKPNNLANFLFFGDIMLDRNVGAKIDKYGLDSLFKNLAGEENRFFIGSDIISANLEGPVTNNGEHYPPVAGIDFAFKPKVVKDLQKYNFNFFNIANNHLTDQGARGVEETRANLQALGFGFSGCADAQVGECSGQIVDVAGSKVALLGFSMVYHNFDLSAAQDIVQAYKAKSDLVIVNIHWGVEYEHQYNTTQANIAHALVESGTDIIIGHHPHVVQGMEFYQNKPIFYSLGNFIFDQYFSADTQQGLSLGLSIDTKTKQGAIYLFPLQSQASAVSLMSGANKDKFLQNFVQWSKLDINQEQQILKGQIAL